LEQGEAVLYALPAVGDRTGLLAATDRRVLWLSQGSLQVRAASYPYGEIRKLVVEVAPSGATITLTCPDGDHAFRDADRVRARVFADQVKTVSGTAEFRRVELVEPSPPAPTVDGVVKERLERLERMRAKGSLTEPEYRANRRRLLEGTVAQLEEKPSHQRPFARRVELP
ncbi:MAG: PH domain-containing protein, partial [Thermoplasmatota archaeon]